MTDYIEIVPGESIGPFKLGMTREQIKKLGIRADPDQADPRMEHYPMVDGEELARLEGRYPPRDGVSVYYDETDRCRRLAAVFGHGLCPPVFGLCGHLVNGMTEEELASILRSLAPDVRRWYGSIHSLAAGIRGVKWEASDEDIMCIIVEPKAASTAMADSR